MSLCAVMQKKNTSNFFLQNIKFSLYYFTEREKTHYFDQENIKYYNKGWLMLSLVCHLIMKNIGSVRVTHRDFHKKIFCSAMKLTFSEDNPHDIVETPYIHKKSLFGL